MKTGHLRSIMTGVILLLVSQAPALAGGHTWDVNEVFSNADGTIQFIELKETGGGNFETGVGGHHVTSTISNFTLTSNVASPTGFRHILLGTATFAALPGAPTPDYIIPGNFFKVTGDTVAYDPFDFWTFGMIPIDGSLSFNRVGGSATNSPTNYAGQTGTVSAAPPSGPPGVPDGSAGSTPMTVQMMESDGSVLSIAWDTGTCSGSAGTHIIYGDRSNLPTAAGGAFSLAGSVCSIGSSPFVWDPAPVAADGSGLIWWLIVRNDGGAEGSWGKTSAGAERTGPGAGGSSGQCGATSRSVSNTCGH